MDYEYEIYMRDRQAYISRSTKMDNYKNQEKRMIAAMQAVKIMQDQGVTVEVVADLEADHAGEIWTATVFHNGMKFTGYGALMQDAIIDLYRDFQDGNGEKMYMTAEDIEKAMKTRLKFVGRRKQGKGFTGKKWKPKK